MYVHGTLKLNKLVLHLTLELYNMIQSVLSVEIKTRYGIKIIVFFKHRSLQIVFITNKKKVKTTDRKDGL